MQINGDAEHNALPAQRDKNLLKVKKLIINSKKKDTNTISS